MHRQFEVLSTEWIGQNGRRHYKWQITSELGSTRLANELDTMSFYFLYCRSSNFL